MSRHHVIISGTGRTGTTFLVQLFTALGLDTGFPGTGSPLFANCNAGMEHDLRNPDAPYIVKNPWLCENLDEILNGCDIVIDHAILPMRELFAAAESRRDVMRRHPRNVDGRDVPGGLWLTTQPEEQESVLAVQLYKLIHTLAKHSIPTTLLQFPRLVRDPDYLFARLQPVLKPAGIEQSTFAQAFGAVARPELVHEFVPLHPEAGV
jgi:hypothetical protein